MKSKFSGEAVLSGFSSLKHRNYRLFWYGQCISLIGTWMQTIGQSWLVLELTKSAFKLSLVNMIQFLPMTIFALFAGTLADRYPKRKMLIFTQSALAVLAVILASLTYFEVVQYWHILVLALLLGIINTLDMPVRQSFFVELVGKNDLMNAIALNSGIFNLARIIGPAIAGLLIGLIGIAACFYINALSFLAVIAGLWMIKLPDIIIAVRERSTIKHVFSDIRKGLKYIKFKKIILLPLILLSVMSAFVMNFGVLIPVYAQQNLLQNATGYGVLMTSMGIGSFIGALAVAAKSKKGPRLRYLVGGAFGMSAFLFLLGFVKNFEIAAVTLFIIGFFSIVFTALVNSIIQLNSEDNMRGRVMSVYSLVFGGVIPLGSMFAGNLTEQFGAPVCMMISGAIGVAATTYAIYFLRYRNVVK
ncbi:MAG: MFS transporter [Saccharofermentanales bacterium]